VARTAVDTRPLTPTGRPFDRRSLLWLGRRKHAGRGETATACDSTTLTAPARPTLKDGAGLGRHLGGKYSSMSPARNVPAPVVTAAVLAVLLALLFGGVVSVFGFVDQQQDLAIGGIVIGLLLLALAWRLWQGGRGAPVATWAAAWCRSSQTATACSWW
jgi:hypothetical protein